ncbi:hypothetical protein F3J44_00255 [Pantoea sp. Tr-811]|uniref:hypothetical protein n=1 Tax=Pantoea sp. Tr-811 TaxID=2608361 RepID=UPI00142139AA|nr:hypothetical protein [Pantoea sp. Tr-811]NIF24801.1 hypothetical protein [Pantoea sp. Tr-811]
MGMALFRLASGIACIVFTLAAEMIWGIPGLIGGVLVHSIVWKGLLPFADFVSQTITWNRNKRDRLR